MEEQSVLGLVLGVILGIFYKFVRTQIFPPKDTVAGRPLQKEEPKQEENEENEGSDWEDGSDVSEESAEEDPMVKATKVKAMDQVLLEKYDLKEEIKMILVVREDLKMGKGKIGAQCGHATLGSFRAVERLGKESEFWKKVLQAYSWDMGMHKKICLKVNSEAELLDLQKKAKELKVPQYVVADAGLTQIKEGSLTVCGLGPAPSKMLAELTSHLKLL